MKQDLIDDLTKACNDLADAIRHVVIVEAPPVAEAPKGAPDMFYPGGWGFIKKRRRSA